MGERYQMVLIFSPSLEVLSALGPRPGDYPSLQTVFTILGALRFAVCCSFVQTGRQIFRFESQPELESPKDLGLQPDFDR